MVTVTEEKDLSAIVEAAVDKHGTHADAFVPILLEIDRNFGYLPAEAIRMVRTQLHQPQDHSLVSEGRLYGLASFYQMLSTRKNGRHVVQFCESAPCHVQGGRELWKSLQETLQLRSGQTDLQGRFTLKTVSCLGICGVGPVILVDDDSYGNVTPEELPAILARYK
jgi:NADH-quinone oxidoreductase subunit E